MLEKVGLPPKPALKGNEWVLDASHCQGCASAFSFFNRKHHCRRCGGIFCGNCTQQRMILRGQGDGPVRTCDPCKKLEDAARFESRYGQRKRAFKGMSKPTSQIQEDVTSSEPSPQNSGKKDVMSDSHKVLHTSQGGECVTTCDQKSHSTGKLMETDTTLNRGNKHTLVTPEILRQQAQQEKRQWIALKREGKGEEALQAFKRAKELERQAESVESALRRTQRRAMNPHIGRKEKHEDSSGTDRRKKTCNLTALGGVLEEIDVGVGPVKSEQRLEESEEKSDLMSALKDLGWSSADLHDAGRKEGKAKSVEKELAEIAAAVHDVEGVNSKGGVFSMQVLAHKRLALALKREGKLAEAKEELKKAKTIERQLEEQEIAYGQESDDDLAAIIQGLEKESATQTIGSVQLGMTSHTGMINFDYEADDDGVEVTDSDMNDPEMVAALRSMGWEEEATAMENCTRSASGKHTASSTLKQPLRKSFGSPGGNKLQEPYGESKDILRYVEASLNENMEHAHVTDEDMEDPYFLSAIKAMGFPEEDHAKIMQPVMASIPKPFEKKKLQQEIQFLKNEALALKRAGNIEKAKEELWQAKHLEKELDELRSQHMEEDDVLAAFAGQEANDKQGAVILSQGKADFIEEEPGFDNVEVTEEDMEDTEVAKELKSFGWQDDYTIQDNAHTAKEGKAAGKVSCGFHPSNTKSELQKELLGLKRAALKLKRGGRLEEAEDELRKARVIEQLMQESETVAVAHKKRPDLQNYKACDLAYSEKDIDEAIEHDMEETLKSIGWNEAEKDVEMVPGAVLDNSYAVSLTTSTSTQGNYYDTDSQQKADRKIFINDRNIDLDSENNTEVTTLREGTWRDSLGSHFGRIQPPITEDERQKVSEKNDVLHPVISGDLLTGEAWGFDQAEDRGGIDVDVLDTFMKTSERPEVKCSTSFSMESTNVKGANPVTQQCNVKPSEAPVKTGGPMTGTPVRQSDSVEFLDNTIAGTPSSIETLKQKILAYKKKALALKRERRLAEAKEQLREAKLLEKELEARKSQSGYMASEELSCTNDLSVNGGLLISETEPEMASSGTLATRNAVSSQEADRSSRPGTGCHGSIAVVTSAGALRTPAQKYTAGKDRLKLQREALAHKRKALALRREGRMEEAEAESELAKSIEKQMEEMGGIDEENGAEPTSVEEKQDADLLDDIFDPQLLAALKGLGIDPKARQKVTEKVSAGSSSWTNEEKYQLEEKIKSEKVRAVQFKRSGRQSEALDALRAAKLLQTQLLLHHP